MTKERICVRDLDVAMHMLAGLLVTIGRKKEEQTDRSFALDFAVSHSQD
jgi:hypothetical protein